jgi:hypothetical protein
VRRGISGRSRHNKSLLEKIKAVAAENKTVLQLQILRTKDSPIAEI